MAPPDGFEESYGALALYYDRLMAHVDYEAWADFALRMLNLEPSGGACDPPRVLDLACGTGPIAVRLAKRGIDVVGIDRSGDMLAVADAKARTWGVRVALSEQDLTSFVWEPPADGAVCLFDSLNYLASVEELHAGFACVSRALRSGAPFLFDLHTEARLREIGESSYSDVQDDVAYIWESCYDESQRICEMHVALFALDRATGFYRRLEETHYERAHRSVEVEDGLAQAGFRLEAKLTAETSPDLVPADGRTYYLARKI